MATLGRFCLKRPESSAALMAEPHPNMLDALLKGQKRRIQNSASPLMGFIPHQEGALDGKNGSVDTLAARLGVTCRHLRRLFVKHWGASRADLP
jgi:transcriptional regulator GlxA family with amidase domain